MTNPTKKAYPGAMISSTFSDLEQHRSALITALQKENIFPVGMETHVAKTSDDIISSSLSMIERSSAYIGLISHRYGQIIESDKFNPLGYSITRLEYEKAKSLDLPILIFIMHEDHDVKKRDVETDPVKMIKLNEFREEAKKGRIYCEFKDFTNFSREAVHLIAQLRREIEAGDSTEKETKHIVVHHNTNPTVAPPELYAQPPYIGSHAFVGRAAELEQLNDWANYSDPHSVLLFEAIGGSGKSMLTWEWITNHASKTRTDWAGKFWYSFYERGAQMTDFCMHALSYITGKPLEGFEKERMPKLGDMLLEHLRTQPWLLVLDGLERVLVAYNRIDAADIPDEELNSPVDKIIDRDPRAAIKPEDDDLLHALASANHSKILISSRLIPRILVNSSGQPITGVQRISLTGLRPGDAETLFRSCNVCGDSQNIQHYLAKNCACHPLVIGILAGLIIDYLPSKGNFDAWIDDSNMGGGKLELGSLNLVQKRNHILKAALANLSTDCKRLLSALSLLSDVIDYETLLAFNPLVKFGDSDAANPNYTVHLQRIVKELEIRGFLQYDGKYHNLHPVVRGVVVSGLESDERLKYGQNVVDYFSQKASTAFHEAETLQDVRNAIHIVTTLQRMGKFQEACDIYANGLCHALITNLGALNENLAILKAFFPNSFYELPEVKHKRHAEYLLYEAALTIAYLDRSDDALKIYLNLLEIKVKHLPLGSLVNTVTSIAWLSGILNRYGMAKRFHSLSLKCAHLSESDEEIFVAEMFYFYFLVKIGCYEEAAKGWEYLKKYRSRQWPRGLYIPGTLEHGYCEFQHSVGKLEESALDEAESLSIKHKARINTRDLLLLRGIWYMDQEKWLLAVKALSKAIEISRSSGVVNTDSEILLAFSKFKMAILPDPVNTAIELSRVKSDNHFLFLAELWEVIGDKEKAAGLALSAYKKYWGDGMPYVNRYYLERTENLLHKLGVSIPVLPAYDQKNEQVHPVEINLRKLIDKFKAEELERNKKRD